MTPTNEIPTLAEQIEALAEKATQGKWVINGPHSDDGSVYIDAGDSSMDAVAIMLTGSAHQQDETDAALIVALQNNLPAIVTALRQAEAAPDEVDPIVRWIDGAIERADRHGNTEGIWLFAHQWRRVQNVLASATRPDPSQAEAAPGVVEADIEAAARAMCDRVNGAGDYDENIEQRRSGWMAQAMAGIEAALARQHGAREGYVLEALEQDFKGRAQTCRTNMDAYDATAASVWDFAAQAVREKINAA